MNFNKLFVVFTISIFISVFAKGQFGGSYSSMRNFQDFQNRSFQKYFESYKKKKENGDNVDYFYRSQQGIVFGLLNATYQIDYTYTSGTSSNGSNIYFSGNLERKIKGMAFGVSAERYFPLGKTSEEALIAFTFGTDMQYIKFNFEETRLNGGQRFTPEHNILQGNIPIGLAYKSGTDAVLKRNIKSGFSFGAGGMVTGSFDFAGGFPSFTIRPYCMAELSFYTGFCWKIRGTGYLGNSTIVRGAENIGLSESAQDATVTIVTKPHFTVSLILMDFSWDWDEE